MKSGNISPNIQVSMPPSESAHHQLRDAGCFKPFGDEPVLRHRDIMQAVLRKARAETVARLAGAAEADDVGDDEKIPRGIERLAGAEQFVGERRLEPGPAGAGGVVDQQRRVDDAARGVGPRRAERDVMLPQLRQRLAGGETEIAGHKIVFAEIGPIRFRSCAWISECRCIEMAGRRLCNARTIARKPIPDRVGYAPCPCRPAGDPTK